ncbi:MAG: hypothetical protein AB7O97_19325 [Planctomycetota bacterium]
MLRPLSLGLLMLAAAPAQDDPAPPPWCRAANDPADLPARLASDDPRELAWAAWAVRERRWRELVPNVRAALQRLPPPPDRAPPPRGSRVLDEVELAALLLLDVLVAFETAVPAEELAPHDYRSLRVPVLILAGRSPHQNQAFLRARFDAGDVSPDLDWHVCGNLLAHLAAPGFAAECLDRCELRLEFEVHDDHPAPPFYGVGCRLEPPPQPAPEPAGFPPLPHYALSPGNMAAPGRVPQRIAFTRIERAEVPPQRIAWAGEARDAWASWLRHLAGDDGALLLATAHAARIRWTGADSMRRRLRPLVRAVDRAFARCAAGLHARGLLTDAELRAAAPRLAVTLQDHRSQRIPPLPAAATLMPPLRQWRRR